MTTKLFNTYSLQTLVWAGEDGDLRVIEDRITSIGRWSVHHSLVFQDTSDGKFYQTSYSEAATELQDEAPFEHDGEALECTEVAPIERMIIVYEDADTVEESADENTYFGC